MNLKALGAGENIPNDFNVVIEIPSDALPVKYEVCKDSGMLLVDRFLSTAMQYPCNYGFIPSTLCDDGDPADVLVLTPHALQPGCAVACRAIGVLEMEDEAGGDDKILAVPTDKLCPMYKDISSIDDLPKITLDAIGHFFEHYKDLESGKWVKVKEWHGPDRAREIIVESVNAYKD